jgi:uncharacterized membrane protein
MTKPSSSHLKSLARGILLGHYTIPMGGFLLVMVITFTLNSLIRFFLPLPGNGSILYLLVSLIISILITLFQTGYNFLLLNMARKKACSLKDLGYAFSNMPDHVILLSLRISLLALLCTLPLMIGTTFLFLNPGSSLMRLLWVLSILFGLALMIRLSLDYSQIYFLYLDNPYLSSREIMRQSKYLMQGNRFRLFYLEVSFLGMALLGIFSFGIGFLWIMPYINLTRAEFYRSLTGELS